MKPGRKMQFESGNNSFDFGADMDQGADPGIFCIHFI